MIQYAGQLEPLAIAESLQWETQLLAKDIEAVGSARGRLSILEAGCGNSWQLKLPGVDFALTGVDLNEEALNIRRFQKRDLDACILGDLRTVSLAENQYDVIYNSFVLEHVPEAERVLANFMRWLKPGGILILRIPDPQSVYGFLARRTPFWFHVFYKRYIAGLKNAGRPGYDPFPTIYDAVVSRAGIHRWCAENNLAIRREIAWGYQIAKPGLATAIVRTGFAVIKTLSLGRLATDHVNLTYVIEKPAVPRSTLPALHNSKSKSHAHDSVLS